MSPRNGSDGYEALSPETLPARLGRVPALAERLGPAEGWQVREVGDGNLNLVFIVEGSAGAAVVKQALPYVRLVGESWPLPLSRAFFEYHALTRQAARDPGAVPEVYYHDEAQALIVMEYLDGHMILRRSLIEGNRHAGLGARLGLFCARTLFRGSDLAMDTARRKADLALFAGNVALCDITENLVFTDPYFPAGMNQHNSPHLDALVAELRADSELKIAAQEMKVAFASKAETMIHGDLHTGSIMVRGDEARVIDPEFAVYGPMGFDVGMLISNFLMAYFAQPGHEDAPGARAGYQEWILAQAGDVWSAFEHEFTRLWREERTGILHDRRVYEDQGDVRAAEQARLVRLAAIRADAMGTAGVEMHRRILGLAHNADFEDIADPVRRAACEAPALRLGRTLAVRRAEIGATETVLELARAVQGEAER